MNLVKAEIISIGNEILIGRTINTNAAYIGKKLFDLGIHPEWVTTIPDTEKAIAEALKVAMSRANVIISTGGLGPTNDDITKAVVTRLLGGELIFDEQLFQKVKEKFAARKLTMPQVNKNQALVPNNAIVLDNEVGTAPGLLFEKNDRYVFVLPGVPREMMYLMEHEVLPFLKKKFATTQPLKLTFRTIGISESALYEKLTPLIHSLDQVDFMFYPAYSGVDVKVYCHDRSCSLENLKQKIYPLIEKYTYSMNEEEKIEEVIQKICIEKGYTLSAAESCTGGLLQSLLTDVSGSSNYFMGGVVSYSNESKIKVLGVQEDDLKQFGAVSEPVARQMALGVQRLLGTTIGIGITGIAGPTGGTPEKPVGLVYIGVAYKNQVEVKRFQFGKDRLINKTRSAYSALQMVWKMLKDNQ